LFRKGDFLHLKAEVEKLLDGVRAASSRLWDGTTGRA